MTNLSRACVLAVLLMVASAGCNPVPAIAPSAFISPATPYQIVAALRESKIDCEITKEALVHCKVDGTDLLMGTVLAPIGMQLMLAVPFPQPACAVAEYHAKLDAFNANYPMVNGGCVNEKVLIVSHRSHLFRGGLTRAELQDFVKRWVGFVVASVNESQLLEREPYAAPAPKKSKKPKGFPSGATI